MSWAYALPSSPRPRSPKDAADGASETSAAATGDTGSSIATGAVDVAALAGATLRTVMAIVVTGIAPMVFGSAWAQVSADSLESSLGPGLREIDPLGTLIQTVLYLALISFIIYAVIKWVLPKFLGGRLVGKGRLEMVEQLHLGGRRSVCVVRSGSREYVLGVTDQQVRLLDVLEDTKPAARAADLEDEE